jgi:hypothetical protein
MSAVEGSSTEAAIIFSVAPKKRAFYPCLLLFFIIGSVP